MWICNIILCKCQQSSILSTESSWHKKLQVLCWMKKSDAKKSEEFSCCCTLPATLGVHTSVTTAVGKISGDFLVAKCCDKKCLEMSRLELCGTNFRLCQGHSNRSLNDGNSHRMAFNWLTIAILRSNHSYCDLFCSCRMKEKKVCLLKRFLHDFELEEVCSWFSWPQRKMDEMEAEQLSAKLLEGECELLQSWNELYG